MPIYERGYTHWEPSNRKAWPAWWVIAKRGIVEPLKSRWLLGLVVLAWMMAVIKAVKIYIRIKAGDMAGLLDGDWGSIDPVSFLSFVEAQRFFVFALLAIVGAGLIATDRQDNGLSLYFSRPLGLKSYLGGKAIIVVFYYCLVTLFPVYALCLFSYLMAPQAVGMELLILTPIRATAFCLLAGSSIALVLLAFSSMGKRTIFIMVWWTIIFSGSEAIGALGKGLHKPVMQALNFFGNYHNAGAFLFSADPRLDLSPWGSAAVVLLLSMGALWVLVKRVRPVEVVS